MCTQIYLRFKACGCQLRYRFEQCEVGPAHPSCKQVKRAYCDSRRYLCHQHTWICVCRLKAGARRDQGECSSLPLRHHPFARNTLTFDSTEIDSDIDDIEADRLRSVGRKYFSQFSATTDMKGDQDTVWVASAQEDIEEMEQRMRAAGQRVFSQPCLAQDDLSGLLDRRLSRQWWY